jgi:hypothetical protein
MSFSMRSSSASSSAIARRLCRALQTVDQRRTTRPLIRALHPKERVEIFSMASQSSNDDVWVPGNQVGSFPGSTRRVFCDAGSASSTSISPGVGQTGYMACAEAASDSLMTVTNHDTALRTGWDELSRLTEDRGDPPLTRMLGSSIDGVRSPWNCSIICIDITHRILLCEDRAAGGLPDHFSVPEFGYVCNAEASPCRTGQRSSTGSANV